MAHLLCILCAAFIAQYVRYPTSHLPPKATPDQPRLMRPPVKLHFKAFVFFGLCDPVLVSAVSRRSSIQYSKSDSCPVIGYQRKGKTVFLTSF
ncbi:unnamed protein product [Somion occarium]|uniref:Secreted protein n=1 Tax=Somion occarium TaxID=3059160 RepID=A0ABP1CU04_9APHY